MSQPLATDPVDLLLDVNGDLVIGTDLQFALGIDGVAQMCRIAVQMFAGEWFLDLDLGVPYWDAILGPDPDVAALAARSGFRSQLLAVNGVLDILVLEVLFSDAQSRTMTINWQVKTAIGNTPVDTLKLDGASFQ